MTTTWLHEGEPQVPTRLLGRTGTRVSGIVLGAGRWRPTMDAQEARDVVDAYLGAGGFTIEVSDAHDGALETLLRSALTGRHERQDHVIVARSGRHGSRRFAPGPDTSRSGLMGALDATLERLGTEHVDLWLVDGSDEVTPAREVAATLEWAVTSGRATQVGLSGCSAWQVVDLSHELDRRGVALTVDTQEHHLLRRGIDDHRAAALSRGHGLIAGAGLAAGVLSGKYRHATPADSRRASGEVIPAAFLTKRARSVVESLSTAADGLGVHPSELALAWQLHTPGLDAVMVGPRSVAQLRVALRASVLDVPSEILGVLDEVSAV